MVKIIRKIVSFVLTAALALSVWSVPVWAQDGAGVTFNLLNVDVVSGDNTWSGDQDYVAQLDIPDGYEVFYTDAFADAPHGRYGLNYTFDELTGEFLIPKAEYESDYTSIQITVRTYDPEKRYLVTCILPDGVTVAQGNVGENAAKVMEDYSITFAYSGDERLDIDMIDYYSEDSRLIPVYTFDEATKTLTIKAEDNKIDSAFATANQLLIRLSLCGAFDYDSYVEKAELPYEGSFTANNETTEIYIDDDKEKLDAQFYEVSLSAGDKLYYNAVGESVFDLYVLLLKHIQDDEFEFVGYADADSIKNGESGIFNVTSDGKYVLCIAAYEDYDVGSDISVTLKALTGDNQSLDFTAETLPTDTADNKWDYNSDTKTLTLKDGFKINALESSIILPDEATVVVEGNAEVVSHGAGNGAIYVLGDIDVELSENAKLYLEGKNGIYTTSGTISITGADGAKLETSASQAGIRVASYYEDEEDIVEKDNAIVIKNVDLEMTGYEGVATLLGSVTIENCKVVADTEEECILVDYMYDEPDEKINITIKNSTLDLSSGEETIQSYIGDVMLENCKTELYTDDEEGIYSYDDIIISGGSLEIDSAENCLESDQGKIELKNVTYNLFFNNPNGEYDIIAGYDVSLSGAFAVYDADMKLLYQGSMSDEIKGMFDENGSFGFYDENGEFIYPVRVKSVIIPSGPSGSNDAATGGDVVVTPSGDVVVTPSGDIVITPDGDDTATDSDTTDSTTPDNEDTNPDMGVKPAFSMLLLAISTAFIASKKKK